MGRPSRPCARGPDTTLGNTEGGKINDLRGIYRNRAIHTGADTDVPGCRGFCQMGGLGGGLGFCAICMRLILFANRKIADSESWFFQD